MSTSFTVHSATSSAANSGLRSFETSTISTVQITSSSPKSVACESSLPRMIDERFTRTTR